MEHLWLRLWLKKRVINKIIWDFQIQTDHSLQDRRQDLVLIEKKLTQKIHFCIKSDQKVKIKETKKENGKAPALGRKPRKIPGPRQRTEKVVEHDDDSDTNPCWGPWKHFPRTWKRDRMNWKSDEELKLSRPQHLKLAWILRTDQEIRGNLLSLGLQIKTIQLVLSTHHNNII